MSLDPNQARWLTRLELFRAGLYALGTFVALALSFLLLVAASRVLMPVFARELAGDGAGQFRLVSGVAAVAAVAGIVGIRLLVVTLRGASWCLTVAALLFVGVWGLEPTLTAPYPLGVGLLCVPLAATSWWLRWQFARRPE